MHQQHREAYAINGADFSRLQFFVSTKVLAHDMATPGPEGVVLVPEGTPGLVVASGPSWLRVRFQTGGQGVVFLANPDARSDSPYMLATEAPGGSGYRLVRDVPDNVLEVGGRSYRIVEGADADLLVDGDDLRKLIEGRRRLEGQRKPEN